MKQSSKWILVFLTVVTFVASLSFREIGVPKQSAAVYYDQQLDVLLKSLSVFRSAAVRNCGRDSLIGHFYRCRNDYKRVEMFVDIFATYKVRVINGPDLLKIDEENPSDSLKPHGLQVLERMLFASSVRQNEIAAEILFLSRNIKQLRSDPDRQYYFSDDRLWRALRLATYRTISMGITGFDAPLSFHSLPETRVVLSSVRHVAGYYGNLLPDSVGRKGALLFVKADRYLTVNNNFNTFDRLTFIREYINPISDWLSYCSRTLGFVDGTEVYPLNPYADNLFTADIFNPDFFSPNDNFRVTPARAALGRRLFYDPILSGDGSRSCASCHKPELAFSDSLKKGPDMTGKKLLLRNTPSLWNAALQTAQFYDSRARILEHQLSAVVHNADEMNGSLLNSIPRLEADSVYHGMFRAAYPKEPVAVSEFNIANAMSSYIRTLISFDSPFDRYIRRQTDSLGVAARSGFNLFMGKARCGTCHYAPLFNGLIPPLYQETESETLAVPETAGNISNLDQDEGRFLFTRHPFHKYAFKTPGVRNVALTAPYMHNGVFSTLEEVVDFYNDGGGAGRGIVLATQTLPGDKLNLSPKEKRDIIAFLQSLTDTSYSHN